MCHSSRLEICQQVLGHSCILLLHQLLLVRLHVRQPRDNMYVSSCAEIRYSIPGDFYAQLSRCTGQENVALSARRRGRAATNDRPKAVRSRLATLRWRPLLGLVVATPPQPLQAPATPLLLRVTPRAVVAVRGRVVVV